MTSEERLHLVAEFGPDESTVTRLCIHAFKVAAHYFLLLTRKLKQKEASSRHESLVPAVLKSMGETLQRRGHHT